MPEKNRRLVLAERPTGNVDDSTVRLERTRSPSPGPARRSSATDSSRSIRRSAPGWTTPPATCRRSRSARSSAAAGSARWCSSNSDRYAVGRPRLRHDRLAGLRDRRRRRAGDAGRCPTGIDPRRRAQRLRRHRADRLLRPARRRPAEGGRHRRRLRRRRRDRVGRRPDRQDQGRLAGRRHRRWRREVRLARRRARLRRRDRLQARGTSAHALREACPDGIDVFFDNVGGEILDDCLASLALRGRVVLCGAISTYNERRCRRGPRNYLMPDRPPRARMEGFIILDYIGRFAEAQLQMARLDRRGQDQVIATHLVEGLENAPDALNLLFTRRQHRQGDRRGGVALASLAARGRPQRPRVHLLADRPDLPAQPRRDGRLQRRQVRRRLLADASRRRSGASTSTSPSRSASSPGRRVLDLGCGWGPLLDFVRERGGDGRRRDAVVGAGRGLPAPRARRPPQRRARGRPRHLRRRSTPSPASAPSSTSARPRSTAPGARRRSTATSSRASPSVLPDGGPLLPADDGVRAQHDPDRRGRRSTRRATPTRWYLALMGAPVPGLVAALRAGADRRAAPSRTSALVSSVERPARLHRDDQAVAPAVRRARACARRCSRRGWCRAG